MLIVCNNYGVYIICHNGTKNIMFQGYFKNGDSAEFVFLTCERLKLPPETRYLALELFDR